MDDKLIARYDEAVMLLPQRLRAEARRADRFRRKNAEEFRLRPGRPLTLLLPEGEEYLGESAVTRRDIDILLEIATGASSYSSSEQIRSGFITVRGGYRIGLCGSTAVRNGQIWNFTSVSSAALRISREIIGAADSVLEELLKNKDFTSTLIISPPGGGKTTLLRDMIRNLSDGDAATGRRPVRISLADERSEVAAMWAGAAQMDVGTCTDVLDSCPKAQAVMLLLRAMNPEIIAIDEITAPEDVEAITRARNCGVKLLATAHADSLFDLRERPLYKGLVSKGMFENIVVIKGRGNNRRYEVIRGSDIK